jgi:hypothetical protein
MREKRESREIIDRIVELSEYSIENIKTDRAEINPPKITTIIERPMVHVIIMVDIARANWIHAIIL